MSSIKQEGANDIYKKACFQQVVCKCIHMLVDLWNKKKDGAKSTSMVVLQP